VREEKRKGVEKKSEIECERERKKKSVKHKSSFPHMPLPMTACQFNVTFSVESVIFMTMTNSTEIATLPKATGSRNSDSSVHIQIRLKFQFEFVPRETEESEFVDSVDFGRVASSRKL